MAKSGKISMAVSTLNTKEKKLANAFNNESKLISLKVSKMIST